MRKVRSAACCRSAEANNSNNEKKRTRRKYETVYRAVPGFVGGRVGSPGRRGDVAASLLTEVEYKRYEGPRVPIVRGGYLRCQPVCDQGCRRDFRRRVYRRGGFRPGIGADQSPLRFRCDSAAQHRRARLPEKRFLGDVRPGGDPYAGADRDVHPPDRRCFGSHPVSTGRFAVGAGPHREGGTGHCDGQEPDETRPAGTGGGNQGFFRREPILAVRERSLYGRSPGGGSAFVDR